ncbi:MAG: tetratricopeptide repeat protein, partial [Bacteroidales bacterium]
MKTRIQLIVLLLATCLSGNLYAQNARQFYKTGLTFVEAGNHKDAIDQFTKALAIDPEYAQAYVERARSYEAIGELQHTADDLKRALTFEQKEPELYFDAARVNFELANYQDALELVNKSIALSKKSEPGFRLLARIQMALEDFSNSLVSINKALELKDNAENNFYRGQLSEKMKNYNQAETDYKNALSRNNKYVEAYLAQAALRLQLNKPQESMESCNAVLNLDANNKEALLIRSRVYAMLTEYPKAIDDLSKILFNNPDDKEMYLVRGTYYQEFTQHQNAINDFSRALMIDKNLSEAVYKRAYSYEQVGDFKSAIKDYESLTHLSADDLVAQKHLNQAKKRLFELNRESQPPKISLVEPPVFADSTLKIAKNKKSLAIRGKIIDASEIGQVLVNKVPVAFFKSGEQYEFAADVDVVVTDFITVQVKDIYDNQKNNTYTITRTEIDPPGIA